MWFPAVLLWQAVTSYDVTATSCALDEAELRRLTTLELRSAGAPALAVNYTCEGTRVTIGLRNRATEIAVERVAKNACCDDVEAERTLALLAAGLFKAAGAALTAKPSDSDDATSDETADTNVDENGNETADADENANETAAENAEANEGLNTTDTVLPLPPSPWNTDVFAPARPAAVAPAGPGMIAPTGLGADSGDAPSRPDHMHVIGLSGQVRGLNLVDPTAMYGIGADYRVWPWPSIGFGGFATALFGSSAREGGTVGTRVIDFGAVASWRFARWPMFALAAELNGGASIVSIEGRATSSGFGTASVTGGTGTVGLSLVPTVIFDRTQLALPLGIGALFRAPRGTIGIDETLQLDGVWVGGALRVSLGFMERRQAAQRGVGRWP